MAAIPSISTGVTFNAWDREFGRGDFVSVGIRHGGVSEVGGSLFERVPKSDRFTIAADDYEGIKEKRRRGSVRHNWWSVIRRKSSVLQDWCC